MDKFRKIQYKLKHGFFSVENVVLLVAIILCLTWTYQSIASMSRNWMLAEKLNSEKKALELAEIEVEAAELENEYFKTSEYQEIAARRLANKQMPGEKMVYLSENSEYAKNKHRTLATASESERSYSNFEKWMMYLFPNR